MRPRSSRRGRHRIHLAAVNAQPAAAASPSKTLDPGGAEPPRASTPAHSPAPADKGPAHSAAAKPKSDSHSLPVASSTAAASGKSSSGLSGGAIAAIAAVVCVIALAGFLFVARKWIMNRRRTNSKAWSAGLSLEPKRNTDNNRDLQQPPTPLRPLMEKGAPSLDSRHSPSYPPSIGGMMHDPLGPRPGSNNSYGAPPSELSSFMLPVPPSPSIASTAVNRHETCIVKRTFVQSLPDELPVTMNEIVTLLAAFDDGWASCVNSRGEHGVVPLECLMRGSEIEKGNVDEQQDSNTWRLSKRIDSMYGAEPGPY